MSDLIGFSKRIEEQLADADRQPHWQPEEAERYMLDVGARRERYERQAARLNELIVQPRLETLAGFFANASVVRNEPPGHCSCWFGYCERFPATTKLAFAIEHDARFEKIVIGYEASMMPLFINFSEQDKFLLPLDAANDGAVAEWVEERLLEFLDAYLRIDRGGGEFEEDTATDPVCGMRINRSAAAASATHRGHPYYFCSTDCQVKFLENPTLYVHVKPM